MTKEKLANYIQKHPTSDDTNLKRMNVLQELERKNTKEQMEKQEKLDRRRNWSDKKIQELRKEKGI